LTQVLTTTRPRPGWYLLGPAFVAAIAYVDPGNVAANISAGAQFGFLLLWVIVLANAMAGLVQYLSAKLGLVTGLSLPEAVAERMRRPTRLSYWAQAELVAMATDLAEVVGGAIALHLLFGLPLVVGGIITGAVSMVLLVVQNRGQHAFERVITGLLLIIAIGFLTSLFVQPPPLGPALAGLLPRFHGSESVMLAAAMLGATVMPHAVYPYSGLATGTGSPKRAHNADGCSGSRAGTSPWQCASLGRSTSPCSSSPRRICRAVTTPIRSKAPTRRSARPWGRRLRSSLRSGCWHRGWRRRRWVPTRER
jgi:NRAMP (natural resistance-associated macrophage protein)-like metal ion transporter